MYNYITGWLCEQVHVRYLYILNAPGSSAKRSMSPNSKASSAKSSSPSSSMCRCHGNMFSQLVRAVVSQKTFSYETVLAVMAWHQFREMVPYCGAPGAFLYRASGSPRRISHPPIGGHLTEWHNSKHKADLWPLGFDPATEKVIVYFAHPLTPT